MKMLVAALVLVTTSIVAGQRPSFAGTRPIGFPDTPNRTTTTPDPLGDRFGEDTTERLPIEANGDRDLIERLSKLPLDKQPFWFINWKAYEQHRKNPQTYPQRPNVFVDPIPVKTNVSQVNTGFSTPSQQTGLLDRFGPATVPNQFNSNVGFGSNPSSNNSVNANSNFSHNVNLTGNTASYNTYPTVNPNLNVYTNKNGNPNNYPTGNSNLNTQSNSGTVKNNVSYFQTTQKYQLSSFNSTNVGNTNLNNHPQYYPRTDSYPQRSGH